MDKRNTSDADIISIAAHRSQMTWSVLQQVEAYWEGLRDGRLLPLRSDVNPRGIEHALENAFVIERIAPGLARFRLAGMHLVDLIGMEVRGMPLTSFFMPDSRKEAGEILEDMFHGPEICEIELTGETGFGKPELTGKMLLLPLKSDLGDVTRALGVLVTDGGIGRTPRRFEIAGVRRRKLSKSGTANPPLQTPPLQPKAPISEKTETPPPLKAGFSEAPAPFEPNTSAADHSAERPAGTKNRKPPVLRLIKNDDM